MKRKLQIRHSVQRLFYWLLSQFCGRSRKYCNKYHGSNFIQFLRKLISKIIFLHCSPNYHNIWNLSRLHLPFCQVLQNYFIFKKGHFVKGEPNLLAFNVILTHYNLICWNYFRSRLCWRIDLVCLKCSKSLVKNALLYYTENAIHTPR
jgi:hypothetical protein